PPRCTTNYCPPGATPHSPGTTLATWYWWERSQMAILPTPLPRPLPPAPAPTASASPAGPTATPMEIISLPPTWRYSCGGRPGGRAPAPCSTAWGTVSPPSSTTTAPSLNCRATPCITWQTALPPGT